MEPKAPAASCGSANSCKEAHRAGCVKSGEEGYFKAATGETLYCRGELTLIYNRNNYVFNYDHMIQDLSRPADPKINSRSWSIPKGSTKWRWEVRKDGGAWQWIESNIPSQAYQTSSSDTVANQALTGVATAEKLSSRLFLN